MLPLCTFGISIKKQSKSDTTPTPPLKHNACIMVHIFCFRVGALVWLRGCAPPFTQVVKTQMLSQLPRPLGCCWFVVCVLSRCLRLAFFAFCCSHPLGSFANSLVGFVLSPSWGFVCTLPLGLCEWWGLVCGVPTCCLLFCVVCGGGGCVFVVFLLLFSFWVSFGVVVW